MVEVGDQDVVLVIDQVDGHVEGGAVFECVVVDFACAAVYDVEGYCLAVAGQDCQVGEIHVFEEDFAAVEEGDI